MDTIPKQMAALAREFDACRPAFIALGDENRQRIIIALLESPGGMRVGELTACTNLSRPAVSHHLKVLKDADIVSMYKVGTKNYYHVDANRTQWRKLTRLVGQVNALVDEVTARRLEGRHCPGRKDDQATMEA